MSFDPSAAANAVLLAIDHTKIDADLTDFPLAIDLAVHAPDIFTDLGADKLKLAVCSSDAASQYYTEIEHWDNTNGKAVLHVKIPLVSASVDTQVKIVWDSAQGDNATYVGETNSTPAENVWDSNFVAVYHMAQDPSGTAPQILDSTSNNHDCTSHGSMTSSDLIDSSLGKAIDFDGNDDCADAPGWFSLANTPNGTLEIKCYVVDNSGSFLFGARDGDSDTRVYVQENTLDNLSFRLGSTVLTDVEINYETWLFCGMKWWDGSNANTFLNSTINSPEAYSYSTTGKGGRGFAINNYAKDSQVQSQVGKSKISEVRISSIARSDAWIKATNASLKDDLLSSILYTVSGTVAENGTPVARKLYLFDRATGVKVAATTSDATTGSYSFAVPDTTTKYFVVALDDDEGTEYNALIADRVTGVLV